MPMRNKSLFLTHMTKPRQTLSFVLALLFPGACYCAADIANGPEGYQSQVMPFFEGEPSD